MIKEMLENGSDVDGAKNDGWTPLMAACWHGNLAVAKSLIKQKACIDLKTEAHTTALCWAARHGQIHIVELLLGNGSDVDGVHNDVINSKHFRVTGHLCGEFTGPR